MSFIGIIDQFFAAHLGTGAIATLSYANRILALILGLGAMAVARATLPVFSQAQAQGGGHLHRVATHWARILFMLGVVAMIVSWWLAPWAVELLFERGAFTARDTQTVTEVFRYGLAQLPFYFAALVLVSLLVSQNKYHVVTVIGALNLVIKIASSAVIVPYFGVNGLMISTSLMLITSCLFLTAAVNKTHRSLGEHK
jgi:peptidoglycan biosynthesis protein MviN/MurJ (putative lipid II flippase)